MFEMSNLGFVSLHQRSYLVAFASSVHPERDEAATQHAPFIESAQRAAVY